MKTQRIPPRASKPNSFPALQKGTTVTSSEPSADQLSAARLTRWHQDAAPLLTIEDLRTWITRSGLILYTSRAQQLPAPAPSLVEATLGTPNSDPTLEAQSAAKNLLSRLIAEGVAVPLNLLGVPGGMGTDTPDFVVSAPVFSYIFTLRGNKAWKQPPVTSGPVKVSPLALAAYEILTAKVTLSAYDLTTQLGKEVTEAAVLRALTELWSQLRVLPIPQQDGSATLWELSTARFTKQIKAGANAGQPSALSALISLYLGQAIAATEEEIETFLSPLAPRSRVRDVVHALMGARQLETFVVHGKTLLHVTGDLPAFAAEASETSAPAEAPGLNLSATEEDGRIRKFTPKPGSKIGTGLRTKPAFGKKLFGAPNRERRPFKRDEARLTPRPTFNKPWEEDRKPRPAADAEQGSERPFTPRPAFNRPSSDRPSRPFGDRPSAGANRPNSFAKRPSFGGDGDSTPRKTFSKPGTFGRKREGGFTPERSDSRPPRRDFNDRPRPSFDRGSERGTRPGGEGRPERLGSSDRPAAGGFKRPGSYSPRPSFGGKPSYAGPRDRNPRPEGGGFAPRKPFTPREGNFTPSDASASEAPRKVFRKFDAPRGPKPFGSKPKFGSKPSFPSDRSGDRSEAPARPYTPRPAGDRPAGSRPSFGGKPSFGSKPAFGKKSFGAKPGGARPSGGKSFSSKPPSAFAGKGGPFAKFADGAKPFRKPGKPRPAGGGFTPTRRKRPDEA